MGEYWTAFIGDKNRLTIYVQVPFAKFTILFTILSVIRYDLLFFFLFLYRLCSHKFCGYFRKNTDRSDRSTTNTDRDRHHRNVQIVGKRTFWWNLCWFETFWIFGDGFQTHTQSHTDKKKDISISLTFLSLSFGLFTAQPRSHTCDSSSTSLATATTISDVKRKCVSLGKLAIRWWLIWNRFMMIATAAAAAAAKWQWG